MIRTHKKYLEERCLERGYKLDDVMDCVVRKEGEIWTIDTSHVSYPSLKLDLEPKINKKTPNIGEGAGTELKKILSQFGIHSKANCSCMQRAKAMNDAGLSWCRENVNIICDWLKEEFTKRNLPFFPYVAKKIIKLAIYRAEKKNKKILLDQAQKRK